MLWEERLGTDGVLPAWPVHAVLGLALIGAGATALYQYLIEVGDDRFRILAVLLAEVELLGGLGMVSGQAPLVMRRLGLALFGGLGAANVLLALAGRCTGGGLGALASGPWLTALLATVACIALLASRPRDDAEPSSAPGIAELAALALAALLIGLAGWREGGLVTVVGTADLDGGPLAGATLALTGNSGVVLLETDAAGRFRGPLLRPGIYAVTVRRVSGPADAAGGLRPAWLTVAECPGAAVRVSFRGPSG